MGRAESIRKGPYRDSLAATIREMAQAGHNDPAIANHLNITNYQVRGIRNEYGIPAGEPRRPLKTAAPKDPPPCG
jgi:hypothetical protein